jgi:hypothetical protein
VDIEVDGVGYYIAKLGSKIRRIQDT